MIHLNFIENYKNDIKKEKEIKYINIYYNFSVITKQEKGIIFPK